GHRKKGISHHLLRGAVDFARSQGAPAIAGYPVDNRGQRVDLTMAYVGTRSLFEQAGFTKVSDTDSVLDDFPSVLMRLDLSRLRGASSPPRTPTPRRNVSQVFEAVGGETPSPRP